MSGRVRVLAVAIASLALVASGVALTSPASATTDTTIFEIAGEPGDPVAGGALLAFTPPATDMGVVVGSTADEVALKAYQLYTWEWLLNFRAPTGETFTAGTTYTNAQNAVYTGSPRPGLWVRMPGRSCFTLTGTFRILQIETDPDSGVVTRFAATFVQRCDGISAVSRGAIYVHSTLDYVPMSMLSLTGPTSQRPGASVALAGSLVDANGPLAGVTVNLSRTDGSGTTALPAVTTAGDGSYAVVDTLGTTDATYTSSFSGNSNHQPSSASWGVSAVKVATTLTLSGPGHAVPLAPVVLAGSLTADHGPLAGATVSVTRTDTTGTKQLPEAVAVVDGSFTVPDTLGTSAATYVATFAGDAGHLASQASWQVTAVKSPGTLTISAPANGTRGTAFSVSGALTSAGAAVPAARLTVTRRDLSGVRTFAVTTSALGAYTFRDVPTIGGPVTFTVQWSGDVTRAALTSTRTVKIARAATSLTIKASASTFGYGARVVLTVHLGTTYNSRYVTVYARPLGTSVSAPGTRLVTAKVNSLGNLTVTYVMTRKTTFTAVFAGDYRYGSATRAVSSTVVSRVTLTMTGYTGTSNGAYLYRHGTDVDFRSTVAPARPGGCEAFVAQAYRSGRWVTITTTSCGRLDGRSTAYMYFHSTAPRGTKCRIRGSVGANGYSAAGVSPWRYFTYT